MGRKRIKTNHKIRLMIIPVFLLIVVLFLANNIGTYSKYQSSPNPTVTFSVAKWNVSFTTNDDEITVENPVLFKVTQSDNIAENRIAPNITAVADIIVDMTGTEVTVDLTATVDSDDIAAAFPGIDPSRITTSLKVNNVVQNTATISYSAIASNPEIPVQISISWDNAVAGNASDTTLGNSVDLTKPIAVTLTATQHI